MLLFSSLMRAVLSSFIHQIGFFRSTISLARKNGNSSQLKGESAVDQQGKTSFLS
jgi:hypothetical protein